MDVSEQDWLLIKNTLQTGPVDSPNIIQHAQTRGIWQTLYLATRESDYALTWRVVFGSSLREHDKSILQLAVQYITAPTLQHACKPDRQSIIENATKVIANCCAENDENRRNVIKYRGLRALMLLLENGYNPNFVIPTIYNVCADLEDPAQGTIYQEAVARDTGLSVTMTEEKLATVDGVYDSVLAGVALLLRPVIVSRCLPHIFGYLANLVEMAARPAAVVGGNVIDPSYSFLQLALARLMTEDGGQYLAQQSAGLRLHICRALLAISNMAAAKAYLATSGEILNFALTAITNDQSAPYFGEDDEEQLENSQSLSTIQTAMLKLAYETCQLPDFSAVPKYGPARQSLVILHDLSNATPFARALAYIVLYNFVDSDTRANLLAAENILSPLIMTLRNETDKIVLYPALGVASKLAVTWRLRTALRDAGALACISRLLIAPNLGYEIPLSTVTFIELMIKGHPDHVSALFDSPTPSASTMCSIFDLFEKGQDAICVEIGRLITEIFSTLAQTSTTEDENELHNLAGFLKSIDRDALAGVLVYMTTKATSIDAAAAQRTWFTLGLISTVDEGREVIQKALHDATLYAKVQEYQDQSGNPEAENVKFMMYHLNHARSSTIANDESLNTAMTSMALS